ncbi:MAG: AtpZ/AtpI family protein [Lachnospiraceae bacterium]|nr:AtpZ/AtpI family protein [Lachnospiraceae bacterium]
MGIDKKQVILIKQNRYKKEVFSNFALISQLGVGMMVPIFLLLAAGIWLENRTGLFLTIPCLILGVLAGCRNTYILANKANRKSEYQKKMEEERDFVEEAMEKWNKNK